MRKTLLIAVLVNGAALALLAAACKAPDGAERARGAAPATPAANASPGQAAKPPQAPADIVRRVTPNEVKGMLERGEAVMVDVRGKDEFATGHIKGALSLPRNELAARASELPKDKLLVFYCA